jgi:phage tail sheath protein FI
MAFQLSPGVNVSEVDLTTVVPSVATTVGGFAGYFNWGPANEITVINNELQLVQVFGKPDDNTANSFFTAANFLAYGSDLRVIRAVGSNARNARANTDNAGNAALIENENDYLLNHSANSNTAFHAKYAGSLGNSLSIEIVDGNTWNTAWTFSNQFDSAPSTSTFASRIGATGDELHIVVVDKEGKISGTANTVLEKFAYVSKIGNAKNSDGTSNYYKDVLNTRSKYIWWGGHPIGGSNWGTSNVSNTALTQFTPNTDIYSIVFTGGVDETAGDDRLNTAYDLFENPDSVDVSLIMSGSSSSNVRNNLITIAESRKDCIVFISPSFANSVSALTNVSSNIVAEANALTKSSYAVMDSGWKYQYDKYNDVYRWIPLNGDIAGLCARTDSERDPWFSPAGLNRGVIKNVVKLSWNPNKAERDALYKAGVNPVVTFPGEGTILYGDKTLLNKPSAFDRINVRRLFIVLEKTIARAARSSLFEFNDEFTRAAFVNLVEPYLREIQGRRGIFDFRVVCDTTNNTPEVIDRNEFVGDIYVKPARSINYIQLNFVAVRTGVAFEEVVGRF